MSSMLLSNSTIFKRGILITTQKYIIIHNSQRIAPKCPNNKKEDIQDIRDNDDPNVNISVERYRSTERYEYKDLPLILFQ